MVTLTEKNTTHTGLSRTEWSRGKWGRGEVTYRIKKNVKRVNLKINFEALQSRTERKSEHNLGPTLYSQI